ncbi:MAG: VTC domain-containing protein [Candidatus Omnitrophica bacterium]|nr:VTC domain-containing protein [Candidatus Omnitrophota bacterium]
MKKMYTNYCMAMNKETVIDQAHMRYERKFFVSELSASQIGSIIKVHPAVFTEIFYERSVNNIYLDSFDMKNYFDNAFGVDNRVKVRVRWYGELFGRVNTPVLELKEKHGLVCRKTTFSLGGFDIGSGFSADILKGVFRDTILPELLRLKLSCLDLSLLNTYRRRYYTSADGKYRLTLDSGLKFYEIRHSGNNFVNEIFDRQNSIVEIKYNVESDKDVKHVTDFFPFRISKSSKYAMGVERLNL